MTEGANAATDVPGVRFLEHTADVGFVAGGPDLKTAFERAALATFSFLVDLNTVQERAAQPFTVRAPDRERLLVEWLTELLYRAEVDGLVFRRFEITEFSDTALKALAYGEPRAPGRHQRLLQIKGVTYHLLAVEETPAGAWVRVVLDV